MAQHSFALVSDVFVCVYVYEFCFNLIFYPLFENTLKTVQLVGGSICFTFGWSIGYV